MWSDVMLDCADVRSGAEDSGVLGAVGIVETVILYVRYSSVVIRRCISVAVAVGGGGLTLQRCSSGYQA